MPTEADPDVWGHVQFGVDIVSSRAIPAADPYSFTSDVPWINHEWLAEVAMGLAFSRAGTAGLVLLRWGLLAVAFAALYLTLRRLAVHHLVRDLVLLVAAVGVYSQAATIRPQVFSLALFSVMLACLTRATPAGFRSLYALPPLFALWVNLHGGWLVGAGALVLWTAAKAFEFGPAAPLVRALLVSGLLSALATLINPYGTAMLDFLSTTVEFGRGDITEWQPIYFYPGSFAHWLLVLSAVAWGALRARRSPGAAETALVVGLALASARVGRLLGFFALAAAHTCGPLLQQALEPLTRAEVGPTDRVTRTSLRLVAAAFVALLFAVAVRSLACIVVIGEWVPDRAAARFVVAQRLKGRMVTGFEWGEYALWSFGPDVKVSMDGRRETVYSSDTRRRHRDLYLATPSGLEYLDSLEADYVWLPNHTPVVKRLLELEWLALFSSEASTVFGRVPLPGVARAKEAPPQKACFPYNGYASKNEVNSPWSVPFASMSHASSPPNAGPPSPRSVTACRMPPWSLTRPNLCLAGCSCC